jgi:pimeloyl-ACP methyl ester carboxylesterase
MKTDRTHPKRTGLDPGPRPRVFTAGRIAALAVIALLILGLGYLRLAPEPQPNAVPAGAKAGDLILESGTYETEDGPYSADVGTLVVPENHFDPDSRLIGLPVVRIRALSEQPGEPLFRLEGGPGVSNMHFRQASRYAQDRDVVLLGYRGVEGSSVLTAPEVKSALSHSTDFLSDESMEAYADAFEAAATRWETEGVDLAGYTVTQIVEDFEMARVALGYDRIDLVSESAGTRTAMIYSWRHPESIHRLIMIGVNPPGALLWDPEKSDEQIERYSATYSRQAGTAKRTEDLAETMRLTIADMPDRWLFLPIKKGNVLVASFVGLMESTAEAGPFYAPVIFDNWLSAAEGDAGAMWVSSVFMDIFYPRLFVFGQYGAFGRIDAQASRDYFTAHRDEPESNLGLATSTFVWAGGRLADALPADPNEGEYSEVRTSEVETLLVSGELDTSTPPQVANERLLPFLTSGHHVELTGIGHSASFWNYQTEAGTRLINTFLASGRVDDSLYQPGVIDFTPGLRWSTLAKLSVGALVGLALFTALSLAATARRVNRRGRFGRVASLMLRSVWPVVLGLGGWSLAALIVTATMPGVALDDELLVSLSMGLPIGLGVYLAWLSREMPATTRGTGLAAAVGAALVGAWLGLNATAGFLAILTTPAGAIAGANLALVALDVIWDRQPDPAGAPAAIPSADLDETALEGRHA